MESPAGYAFQSGQNVISNHVQEDARFRTPKLLSHHGVKRAINVLIARGGEGHLPFGVLEVDSPDEGQFDLADANYLAAFAGLLGLAIERQQADAGLQEALDHKVMLTREISHRVKNSLGSVVGLLRVQARSAQSPDVQNALKDAASRITTIAEVHDHLWRSSKIGYVDIADFAGELCSRLHKAASGHKVSCNFSHQMISADKAIPLGLLINELVTNAVKHAYPGASEKSGLQANAAARSSRGSLGYGGRSPERFRYRSTSDEPRLQDHQEPARSARWTHRGSFEHIERHNYPARCSPWCRSGLRTGAAGLRSPVCAALTLFATSSRAELSAACRASSKLGTSMPRSSLAIGLSFLKLMKNLGITLLDGKPDHQ
jgi:Histidine kinase/GAF domain